MMQHRCSLFVHDVSHSEATVLLNLDLFPPTTFAKGDVIQITAVRDIGDVQTDALPLDVSIGNSNKATFPITTEGSHSLDSTDERFDATKGYFLVIEDTLADSATKIPGVQVSMSAHAANALGLRNRSQVDPTICNASHVEIVFRDEYLSRSDMWALFMNHLAYRTAYKDQKIWFMRTIKASVRNIYVRGGQKVQSAVCTPSTKPIFRSECARYMLFIQMSKEMWDFDGSGSGEIMFSKVINGFLPELFRRWQRIRARHLVTIILFTRMQYETEAATGGTFADGLGRNPGNKSNEEQYSDFYRVVVSDMGSGEWPNILARLKLEFKSFLRDVSIRQPRSKVRLSVGDRALDESPEWIISGQPCIAACGNILEAISLGLKYFSYDYIDRDLVRTGASIAIVTPGTGLFDVDHQLLVTTTDNLVANGIDVDIDLVCLASPPLHSVPLFRYKDHQSITRRQAVQTRNVVSFDSSPHSATTSSTYHPVAASSLGDSTGFVEAEQDGWCCIPYWIDISFWTSPSEDGFEQPEKLERLSGHKLFRPRVRMYELQNLGVMENAVANISIPYMMPIQWRVATSMASGPAIPVLSQKPSSGDLRFRSPSSNFASSLPLSSTQRVKATSTSRQLIEYIKLYDEETFLDPNGGRTTASQPSRWTSNLLANNVPNHTAQSVVGSQSSHVKAFTKTVKKGTERKSRPFSRQLNSLGPPGFGIAAPKAIASTELTAEHAQSRSLLGQSLRLQTSKNPTSTISSRRPSVKPGSMISTYSSNSNIDRQEHSQSSDSDAPGSSRPIAIRNTTAGRRTVTLRRTDVSDSTHSRSTSMVPWLTIVNPSNPKPNISSLNRLGRWQHVFPRPLRAANIKWRSLCFPAAVPLTTENFPTAEQLSQDYEQLTYSIDIPKDDGSSEQSRSSNWLLREMISLRLSYGYQIAVHSEEPEQLSVFDRGLSAQGELKLYKGGRLHALRCVDGNAIRVTCFSHHSTTDTSVNSKEGMVYMPLIRTMLAETYTTRNMKMIPKGEHFDWRELDALVAGHGKRQLTGIPEGLPFWRARFVLIPVDPPSNHRRQVEPLNEDNDEEIRLEGIRKLTQIWQKFRHVPADERRFQTSTQSRKETNPLDIMYQTRNLSAIVAAEKENMAENAATGKPAEGLPQESELFQKSHLTLDLLSQTMQSVKGVRMRDRRWHWRLHYNCFTGFEFTSWLLQNVRDIDSRDEAVEYGNKLMKNGLFQHVEQRHNFRDGNYFYQISSDYRAPRAQPEASTWFGSRKSVFPFPAQPPEDVGADPRSRESVNADEKVKDDVPKPTTNKQTLGVVLSKSMLYDVDHRKRSYRPELITLHYDRLHNPDSCYHIRIDWLNVTSKFIEDAIVSWAITVERFGLRLVEVPLTEASAINDTNPFRAPYRISLVRSPPEKQPKHQCLDARCFSSHDVNEKHLYQKSILKKFEYVLDFEAANDFPQDVDVAYSWGKPDYKYPQYIHRSGKVLGQITDEGDFMLLANRLFNDRNTAGQDTSMLDRDVDCRSHAARTAGFQHSPRGSPFSSPMLRPTPEILPPQQPVPTPYHRTPEQLMDELQDFCHNETALNAFYKEILDKPTVPGRRTPYLEGTIPAAGLPPILSLGEESSASP